MPQKTGHLYEFGPFVLDTAQYLLSRDGKSVPLTPKTYDLLLLLVESRGRLLSKSELMKALWPNSFVEESNLTQQVSMIRKALGESAGEDRYIITISGRGYRFAATVKGPPEESSPATEEPSHNETTVVEVTETHSVETWPTKRVLVRVVGLLLVVLIAFGYNLDRK